ncbi:MAG: hypothetical protein WA944_12920 [Mycobacterium sp.]
MARWRRHGSRPALPGGDIAYSLCPVFALASVVVLVRSSGGVTEPRDDALRHSRDITVLDGVVAAVAFLILCAIGDFGVGSTASLPRSENPVIEVGFALAGLVVVVAAVVITMVYSPERPFRANYLLLAAAS